MWLWYWHFYHSCLPTDIRIIFWILKNLTLRDTFGRTPKVISNQNLISRFQSWIKQSDWPWKFWEHWVFHYSRVGMVLAPSAKKWPNPYPIESLPSHPPPPPSPHTHTHTLPLNLYIITWSWVLKSKN